MEDEKGRLYVSNHKGHSACQKGGKSARRCDMRWGNCVFDEVKEKRHNGGPTLIN